MQIYELSFDKRKKICIFANDLFASVCIFANDLFASAR